MANNEYKIELHPLQPFLPKGAKILMLGSFPPKHERWSMEFYYPNFQNDMWRILGHIFFNNKLYFVDDGGRRFCKNKVEDFCTKHHIALFDAATAVKRLKDNAADKFLEIVEPTDIAKLLDQIPDCVAIATTGQKATDTIVEIMQCSEPKVGGSTMLTYGERAIQFYRMPSSSRAYPLSIDKKADTYRSMFSELGFL